MSNAAKRHREEIETAICDFEKFTVGFIQREISARVDNRNNYVVGEGYPKGYYTATPTDEVRARKEKENETSRKESLESLDKLYKFSVDK